MTRSDLWWERPDLRYRDGRLEFAGRELAALAAAGTPAYVYSAGRMRENLARLQNALTVAKVDNDIYFALKALKPFGLDTRNFALALPASLAVHAAVLALCIACATVLFRTVEVPGRSWMQRRLRR